MGGRKPRSYGEAQSSGIPMAAQNDRLLGWWPLHKQGPCCVSEPASSADWVCFHSLLKSGSGDGGGEEQPNRLKKKPFDSLTQLLEPAQVVRHPISRKRNAFHYLTINWVCCSSASLPPLRAPPNGEAFKNFHKFVFPMQSTGNPET